MDHSTAASCPQQGAFINAPRIENSAYQFRDLSANRRDIRLVRYCGIVSGSLSFELIQFQYHANGDLASVVSAHRMRPPPYFKELDEGLRPPYVALSYEWGSQHDRRDIIVDGLMVSITKNLYDALRQLTKLRHLESTDKIQWIWVDALCIRQDDFGSEKHSLIPNMDNVYREADAVYAWVGKSSHSNCNAMKTLQKFARSKTEIGITMCSFWPEACDEECWVNVLRFADRTFWGRLWIVQEIALARKVIVVCGTQVVDFEGIKRMLASTRGRSSKSLRFIRTLHLCRLDLGKKKLKLLSALWRTRRSHTQFATDRVYALLAMCNDWRDFLDEPESIRPRSTMSEVELNLHMTQRWLSRNYSLDIILLSPASTTLRTRLPSWCPDFLNLSSGNGGNPAQGSLIDYLDFESRSYNSNLGSSDWWQTAEVRRLGVDEDRWQTTNGSQLSSRATRRTSDRSLEVKGVLVDRVRLELRAGRRRGTSIYHLFDRLIEAFCIYDPSFEDKKHCALFLVIIFWVCPDCEYSNLLDRMTICTDVNDWLEGNRVFRLQGYTIEAIVEARLQSYLLEMEDLSWREVYAGTPSRHPTPSHIRQKYFEHKLEENPQAFTNSFLAFRKLILEGLHLSEFNDGFLGWVPAGVVSSDEVYLLKGCSFPVVLRQYQSTVLLRVIGRVYLHRLMTGCEWECQKTFLTTIHLV